MNTPPTRLLMILDCLYRWLLAAYPRSFQSAFGKEMAQVFRHACDDAYRQGGAMAVLPQGARMLGDLVVTAAREHLSQAQPGLPLRLGLYLMTALLGLWIGMRNGFEIEILLPGSPLHVEGQIPLRALIVCTCVLAVLLPKGAWLHALMLGFGVPIICFTVGAYGSNGEPAHSDPLIETVVTMVFTVASTGVGLLLRRMVLRLPNWTRRRRAC